MDLTTYLEELAEKYHTHIQRWQEQREAHITDHGGVYDLYGKKHSDPEIKPHQVVKTLWLQYDDTHVACVLREEDKLDTRKLVTTLKLPSKYRKKIRFSKKLPAMQTPGTAGPWSLEEHCIYVDSQLYTTPHTYTQFALPGRDHAKLYLGSIDTSIDYTAIADITLK